MPVSNPPFGYYSVSNKVLEIYSRGHNPSSPGQGKNLYLYTPAGADAGPASYGGRIELYGGVGANSSARPSHGGHIYMYGGNGGDTVGAGYDSYGGNINLYGGKGGHTDMSNSNAGYISLIGGDSNSDSYFSYAGDVILVGGYAAGAYANYGGKIRLTAGDASGLGANAFGGDIHLTLGGGATQAGNFIISRLPTVAPTASGAVWSNLGILTIVP